MKQSVLLVVTFLMLSLPMQAKAFSEQGGVLVTDINPASVVRTFAGYANQHTQEILVDAGVPFMDAVKICTANWALNLGQKAEIASIEVDIVADLVLIDEDLRKNSQNYCKMETIFKNGIGFDSCKKFESVRGVVGLY